MLTFCILQLGLDWKYFILVRNETLNAIFLPALIVGGLLPIVLPLILIARIRTRVIGWTLAQAALLGSFVSSLYKAFTGRIQPNLLDIAHDSSHSFNFGFMEHGIFWGWPSSHTTIAFAMAFALITLFPHNRKVKIGSIVYAMYIGIGILFSIHWLSEFIAGALIGYVIGKSVVLEQGT